MAPTLARTAMCPVCGISKPPQFPSLSLSDEHDLELCSNQQEEPGFCDWRFGVQRCDVCGYCSPGWEYPVYPAKKIVASSTYQEQLGDHRFARATNSLLCYSLIAEAAGDYENAALISLEAAWDIDDSPSWRNGSAICRQRALSLLRRAASTAERRDPIEEIKRQAVIVELLRRTGQLEEAISEARFGIEALDRSWERWAGKEDQRALYRQVLRFQVGLCAEGTKDSYRLSQAVATSSFMRPLLYMLASGLAALVCLVALVNVPSQSGVLVCPGFLIFVGLSVAVFVNWTGVREKLIARRVNRKADSRIGMPARTDR